MATPGAVENEVDWSSNYDSWSFDDPTIPDIIDAAVFNDSATTAMIDVTTVRVPVSGVFASNDHWMSLQGFLGGLLAGISLMLVLVVVINIFNRCRKRRRRKRRIDQIMMADKDSPCLLNINTSTLERADANIEPVDEVLLYETPMPQARIPVTMAARQPAVIPRRPNDDDDTDRYEDDDTDRYENDHVSFVRMADDDASTSEGELENEPYVNGTAVTQNREETVRLSHEYHYVGPLQARVGGHEVVRDSVFPPTDNGDEVGQERTDGHLIQPVSESEVYSYVDMRASGPSLAMSSQSMEHKRIGRVTTV